jgi:hypothetical protein
MTTYRPDLPPRPERMARLPLDERGFPIPWFVSIDKETGKPDFRVIRPNGIGIAYKSKTCWLCGEFLGRYQAYVIGPRCGVNRGSSEPPCHRECAEYATKACPFLTRPLFQRNERGLPEERIVAGEPIKRNPGCALIWVQKTPPKPFRAGEGYLFQLDEPSEIAFWAHGRKATLEEVRESVRTGLPFLEQTATERDGPEGVAVLKRMVARFERMLASTYGAAIEKGSP